MGAIVGNLRLKVYGQGTFIGGFVDAHQVRPRRLRNARAGGGRHLAGPPALQADHPSSDVIAHSAADTVRNDSSVATSSAAAQKPS